MATHVPSLPLVVICPHFAPDNAPTGTVMTRIVDELVERGHRVHVVTSLPWYREHRIDDGWGGRLVRRERTTWGTITRVHPFPGGDKSNLLRRAIGFFAYSLLAGVVALSAGGWFRRSAGVVAMSPPLTLAPIGRMVAWLRRAPLVFNIQDVFPDAAVETGAITNRHVIRVASWLERVSYRTADAVTVLSDDLADNVRAKLPGRLAGRVHVIPNFVDTDVIRPGDRMTERRRELEIGDEPVVLYAGNLGFSQSFDLLLDAAERRPNVTFLFNGDGSARSEIQRRAAGRPNVRVAGYIEPDRLSELLATGDIHVVPLKRGLARVSVPSKTYSILAAGRPALASIDPGTAVPTILDEAGAGVSVPPDDLDAFLAALDEMLADPASCTRMGRSGRSWVVDHASPSAVGDAYGQLIRRLATS